MPSPTSPAPSTAPNAPRAGGVNQPREAARASRRTTPSSVTAPPVQASSRAPVSDDRFRAAGAGAPQPPAGGPAGSAPTGGPPGSAPTGGPAGGRARPAH